MSYVSNFMEELQTAIENNFLTAILDYYKANPEDEINEENLRVALNLPKTNGKSLRNSTADLPKISKRATVKVDRFDWGDEEPERCSFRKARGKTDDDKKRCESMAVEGQKFCAACLKSSTVKNYLTRNGITPPSSTGTTKKANGAAPAAPKQETIKLTPLIGRDRSISVAKGKEESPVFVMVGDEFTVVGFCNVEKRTWIELTDDLIEEIKEEYKSLGDLTFSEDDKLIDETKAKFDELKKKDSELKKPPTIKTSVPEIPLIKKK